MIVQNVSRETSCAILTIFTWENELNNMTPVENHFIEQLKGYQYRLDLSSEQVIQLRTFYENLVEWNKVMNLTTITDEEDVYTKHFLDSLSLLNLLPGDALSHKTLIDVGTGAGFPGLVIAIAFPDLHVTLMDSLNKRINFLYDTVAKCHLTNVSCVHARAEELGRNREYRETYEYAVSRAVANASTLSEYCIPLIKIGGIFIAYKADKLEEELSAGEKAVHLLGGTIINKMTFDLPDSNYSRTLLAIQKVNQTSKKYPRKAGTPAKQPLGV